MTVNRPYLIERYAKYHTSLRAPGIWQLFKMAVKFRKGVTSAQDQARWAKSDKRRKDEHRFVGEEIASQRAWVEATEGLMEVFDFSQGSQGARDLFDLVMTVAAGNYTVPSPDQAMSEEDILARMAEFS
jgi:hypothetical protein